jgi:hypothetical protein
MIIQRQSRLPFLFSASIATAFVSIWFLGLIGVLEVESPSKLLFTLITCLFFLPIAVLMWIRVFHVPLAARIESQSMTFWSMELFPKRVSIPTSCVLDARIVEKEFFGETVPLLRLDLSDCEEMDHLRSAFKSVPGFGFQKSHFDCSLGLTKSQCEDLADKIREYLRGRPASKACRRSGAS